MVSLDTSARDDLQDYVNSLPDDEDTPDERIVRKEVTEVITAVLERLPESYRTVITNRYINGLSSREAAEVMGKTEGNIRVILHRASNAFIRELGRLEEEMGETLIDRPGDIFTDDEE